MDRKTKLLIAIGIVVVVLAAAAIGVVVAGLLTNWFRGNEPSTRVRVFATNRTHMFQEVAALTLSKGEQPSLENKVSIKQGTVHCTVHQ